MERRDVSPAIGTGLIATLRPSELRRSQVNMLNAWHLSPREPATNTLDFPGGEMIRLALLMLILGGCVTTTVVTKNPTAGQVIVCQRQIDQNLNAATACADALRRDGWVELGRDSPP
jgi:hypothetical protein